MRSCLNLVVLVALCCLVHLIRADLNANHFGPPRNIVTLTDKTFDDMTSQGVWLLDFYAPWCVHCQKFAPELEEAAKELLSQQPHENVPPEKQIFIGLIDCTQETELKQRFKVQGYPTILTYRAKTGPRTFRGQRTKKGVVDHMLELLQPAVHPMADGMGDLMAIMSPGGAFSDRVAFIFLASGTGDGELNEKPFTLTPRSADAQRIFQDVALSLQGVAKFYTPHGPKSDSYLNTLSNVSPLAYATEDAKARALSITTLSLARRLGVTEDLLPAVVVVSPYLPPSVFVGSGNATFTEATLGEWIKSHKLPLINTLGPVNFDDITNSGKRTLFIAVDPSHAATRGYLMDLIPLAKEFHHKFTFATIDGVQFSSYVAQFGIQRRHLPILLGLDYADELYYVDTATLEAGTGMYTVEEQRAFLTRLAADEIPPKGLTAWYSPARYTRMIERFLGQYTETQLIIGIALFVTLVSAFMIWACCMVMRDQPHDDKPNAIDRANQARRAQRDTARAELVRTASASAESVSDDDTTAPNAPIYGISVPQSGSSNKKKQS